MEKIEVEYYFIFSFLYRQEEFLEKYDYIVTHGSFNA